MNELGFPEKHAAYNRRRPPAAGGANAGRARALRRPSTAGRCNARFMRPAKRPVRGGYALLIVLVFVMLFLTILGVAWRQIGSLLNIETVRAQQMTRDRGSLMAAAKGLRLLEMTSDRTLIEAAYKHEEQGQWYKVTFTVDGNEWTISAFAVAEEPDCDVIPPFLSETP